jgi:type IV pilus assembly protein PilV
MSLIYRNPIMCRAGQSRAARRQAGFSLVELMIALIVLSIGLLGVAKLSLSSVQANGSAYMRSQATELIQEIVDDMRANQPQAIAGGYNIAMTSTIAAPGTNCETTTCTAAQVATFDVATWVNRLNATNGGALPSGAGSITVAQLNNPVTGSPENTAIVTVQWDDTVAQTAFAGANATPVTTLQITVETLL